jgi:hypothetical protein
MFMPRSLIAARPLLPAALLACGIALVGCSPKEPAQPAAAPPPSKPAAENNTGPYLPDSNLREIMQYIVMPNAQIIWDSVAITVSLEGTDARSPKTDEDWDKVRAAAITLMEACNSLMIPGRAIDLPGTASDDPENELGPDDIEEIRVKNWDAWIGHAQALHATAKAVLSAIDKRDSSSLMDAGGPIDEACESCHLQFWYPPDRVGTL